MMKQRFLDSMGWPSRGFRSLSFKLLSAILIWAVFLLGFIGFTVFITWRLEDGAVAINEAGRLNNQIYRLAAWAGQDGHTDAQTATIRQTLASLEGRNRVFCCRSNPAVEHSIRNIRQVVEAFAADADKTEAGGVIAVPLIRQADALQAVINGYAEILEQDNTRSIGLLRWMRIALTVLIIGSALACFVMLRQTVLRPLSVLHGGISKITNGNLTTRLSLQSRDEFKMVSDGFNQMAANLQDIYTHLEDKVAHKTAELSRQNYEWETLYHITSYLHTHDFGEEVQRVFLSRILLLAGLKEGGLFWLREGYFTEGVSQGWGEGESLTLSAYLTEQQKQSIRLPETAYVDLLLQAGKPCRILLIAVNALGGLRGVMALHTNAHEPTAADERLIGLLCTQLGIAEENAGLTEWKRQHAVLEERNLIAQGLHDSLAQSLSFLNMRFQMLRKHDKLQQDAQLKSNLAMIQDGIDYCYEDVRELLNNFRTQSNEGSFAEALAAVVARYRRQTGMEIKLYIVSEHLYLNAEQQLQVLFILQEALSNIRKHASTREAEVLLDDSGDFSMSIRDNGCGFDTAKQATVGHIGLTVMRERAEKIGAIIRIDSQVGQGTHISLKLIAGKR